MNTIRKMLKRIHETSEHIGKARALSGLRAMDPNWLEEYGYSIEALNRGIEAWPWRKPEPTETGAAAPATVTTLSSASATSTPDSSSTPEREDAA